MLDTIQKDLLSIQKDISKYQQVEYPEFARMLKEAFDLSGKRAYHLLEGTGKTSPGTIMNAFNEELQSTTDKVLTIVANHLDFDCLVIWQNGQKFYLVRKQKR